MDARTWVWGPIGPILSTLLMPCLVVMARHVKSLAFFDVLAGDRPALAPIETFYQRILANNSHEALAQAEVLLGNRTLVNYFDEVVLPSLKLGHGCGFRQIGRRQLTTSPSKCSLAYRRPSAQLITKTARPRFLPVSGSTVSTARQSLSVLTKKGWYAAFTSPTRTRSRAGR